MLGDKKMIIQYTNLNKQPKSKLALVVEWILTAIVNTLVILMASVIFTAIYVESIYWAFLAGTIIMVFNKTIKQALTILALPLIILTLGLFYPIVNVIILKLTAWIIGDAFVVSGWFVPFFVAIFISIMTIILDVLITKRIVGGIK
jgi:putative membrane protein